VSLTSSRVFPVCLCMAVVGVYALAQQAPASRKAVDLHSAIALSQAKLYGTTGAAARADRPTPVADVLMLVSEEQWAALRARLAAHGMSIRFEDAKSGYIRATVPFDDVRVLFEWPEIDAARVDGAGAFDTRLQPQNLRTSLGFSDANDPAPASAEVEPAAPASERTRPLLTVESARRYPINTDQDMGATEFRAAHPSFDGRGVGIGVLETTWLPIDQPAYAEARALDGSLRRKVLRYPDTTAIRSGGTSTRLSEWFECKSSICTVNERVIRLPAAGRYRLADYSFVWPPPFGCPVMTTVAILQHHDSGRLYVDGNHDLDFLDEAPLIDFNAARWDRRSIATFKCGTAALLKVVVTLDRDGQFARLHPFSDRHATMTSTVAAGSEVEGNLAVGVAPNAALVVVEAGDSSSLAEHLEGAIVLARDPDVDVLYAALTIHTPLGTSESFDTRAFDRISEAYNKPILISAGNNMTAMATTPAPSGRLTMAVGQYVSSATVEAIAGVKRPEAAALASTVGPAWDGAPRPDFTVPSRRVAAFPCVQGKRNPIQFDLPTCHTVSNGTSAASPSAAGAVALLLSAAKQRGFTPSVAAVREALIASARLMPGIPIHTQGAGLINLPRAWEHLQRRSNPTTLAIDGELRHAFVDLLSGARPKGLFWIARSNQSRSLTLTVRVPPGGNVGPLSIQSEGDLSVSVDRSVDPSVNPRVPVTMTPPALGRVASSWIRFADSKEFTVGRALATAARPVPLAAPTYEYAWKEEVDVATYRGTVVTVPAGTTGMLLEVDRLRGDVGPTFSNPLGAVVLPRSYWSGGGSFVSPVTHGTGHVAGVWMDPAAGDWGTANIERSAVRLGLRQQPERGSLSVRMTAFQTLCSLADRSTAGSRERVRVRIEDAFAKPVNGGVVGTPATVHTERIMLRDEFDRPPITIDVKPGTAAFHVSATGEVVMLQLFDCTQGHCIPVVQTIPGAPAPALNVRQPRAGVWQVFAVPIRTAYKPTIVDVTVTQGLEAGLTTFTPVADKTHGSTRQLFEGDVPLAAASSGFLLLRTDERAKVNKEGWGAISVCAVQSPAHSR
jgi:hypothetical protein